MRLPYVIVVLLLCAFVPLALASGDDEGGGGRPVAPIPEIAAHVAEIRKLPFDTIPEPTYVSAEQATEEGMEILDRDYSPERQRADETLYGLLGLLPVGTDLRDVSESIFGEEVAGYYDPEDGRLRVVRSAFADDSVLAEMILAHELDHALEDQALGFDMDRLEAGDDRAFAYQAVIEGSATFVMFIYLQEHVGGEDALASLLAGSFAEQGGSDLPPFVMDQLIFPYIGGQTFVAALTERADGDWTLVDSALTDRPPTSTEQIMHPQKWIEVEEPDRVTLPDAPAGFDELAAGTFGEWQTGKWVRNTGVGAGWGGDRYALYERGNEQVLVMRWVWDTREDLDEFVEALPSALERTTAPAHATDVDDGRVTVVLAPDRALAERLARS